MGDTKRNPMVQMEDSNWSELNSDVLELIFSKLPEVSILTAASVCKGWYSVTEKPIFSKFYKENRNADSCSNKFLYIVNGVNYAFTEHYDGQGSFEFLPIEKNYRNVPTVSSSEDGVLPTTDAAGGLRLTFTGIRQSTLCYKLSLLEKNWRTTPQMQYFVQDPVVGVVERILNGSSGHKIVVAGGSSFCSEDDKDLAVSIYDEDTDSWEYSQPLPREFRGCTSSLFMAGVVHKNRFFVYDMYSGSVSWLDLESRRWSPVVQLKPWAKVSQIFLVSRSGVLRLVGVKDASDRDISFTVWNVADEFEETIRVGELAYRSRLVNAYGAPPLPTRVPRWASWPIEVLLSAVGALLLLLVNYAFHYYTVARRGASFLQGLVSSAAIATMNNCSVLRLGTKYLRPGEKDWGMSFSFH